MNTDCVIKPMRTTVHSCRQISTAISAPAGPSKTQASQIYKIQSDWTGPGDPKQADP